MTVAGDALRALHPVVLDLAVGIADEAGIHLSLVVLRCALGCELAP